MLIFVAALSTVMIESSGGSHTDTAPYYRMCLNIVGTRKNYRSTIDGTKTVIVALSVVDKIIIN